MNQRGGRKIRAVLVIDVPKSALGQDSSDVRNLKEDDRAAFRRGDTANGPRKAACLRNVLKGHLAANEVRRRLHCILGEVLSLEDDIGGAGAIAFRYETRIVAHAPIASQRAEKR